MFNSYYAQSKQTNNVTVNTPSSIAGILVKSHTNSKMVAIKVEDDNFNEMFNPKQQRIKKYKTYDTWVVDEDYVNIIILQTMLANDGWIFIEYVEENNE